ncbi:hypothetical protein KTR10_01665 [Candidatus Kaiserbacteria bacterium]|nr:hypothetical protein [Candidatus Kaiserbacteria bacterium]
METFITAVFEYGRTIAVGASTFAVLFFLILMVGGEKSPVVRKVMHTVYAVLRVGMVLIGLSLIGMYFVDTGIEPLRYVFLWVLLIIITVNAVLMTAHIMNLKYGPVIAAGSWYSMFFVSVLPIHTLGVPTAIGLYIAFLVLVYIFIEIMKPIMKKRAEA